jgi:hypothetical protein
LGWLGWLRRRKLFSVGELGSVPSGETVEFEGIVEALEVLRDPVEDEACVAMEYRVSPPSTTVGIDGATSHNSRAFELSAHQAVEFVVREEHSRVLVQPRRGQDVGALHLELLERYGVQLRVEVVALRPGAKVRVVGRVAHRRTERVSPWRTDAYAVVVAADNFWQVTHTNPDPRARQP